MFQYAQSLLAGLASLEPREFEVVAAFTSQEWRPEIERHDIDARLLRHGAWGQWIANMALRLCIPGGICRMIIGRVNPLSRELEALGCDVMLYPAQDAMTYQSKVNAIGTVHDLMHRHESRFPEVSSFGRYRIREHRFGNIARYSRAVLVDSRIGQQQFAQAYARFAGKAFVLPYVAPTSVVEAAERPDFDVHYRLPPKFLFYPAQFWPHKNHIRLVEALYRASRDCADMKLVLCGGHRHQYQYVVSRAREIGVLDRIIFPGYVPDSDLGGFYRRARALVMPTFFGPTNIPPLEAFALGCPVAISGIYGMPEQAGDAALYFDPESIEQITETCRRLWRDDALVRQLAARGKDRALVNGQDAFNSRLQAVLRSVVEMPAPGR